ncbi:hypothetical protein O181_054488 [Austropuccinia psidii MF-1]|uniref:HAT C-terminal dimerisation domain-containing protein n=1 Tax=Austropuccinia psidii MF-1 TaxID=1389203 RepID=A0A9Q3E6A7_9BASI|nr:hypothetical protein [Austropuccinia psidii MF-1]
MRPLPLDQIWHYYSNEAPFNLLKTSSAQNYWLQLPSNKDTAAIKRISIALLEVVPHASGVESLLSMMSAVTTKGQNRMAPNTLRMVSQIKLNLLENYKREFSKYSKCPSRISKKRILSDHDFMDFFDSFLLPDELENFEEEVFQNGSEVQSTRNEEFMDTLFDSEMFNSSTMDSEEVITQGLDIVEEKWEIHHLL